MIVQLATLLAFIGYVGFREYSAARERAAFLSLIETQNQRIQAPEVAVQQHVVGDGEMWAPAAVPMDDDNAHWQSKERLAEMLKDQGA